ncbi:MAG: TlyA family RNA methyltransferase [Aquihabitans sp.]
MVRRGLVANRELARLAVAQGQVVVGGAPATNPSRLVSPGESVAVKGPPPQFVSRGGHKLQAALERFRVDLSGRRVLDVGSSTGGFTDCALQAGAAQVVSVDVGRGLLHRRLVTDQRVELHERTNIRHLSPGDLGPLAEVVVGDVSFISLTMLSDTLLALATPGADLLLLVKPQFEAGREEVDAGRGVITDPSVWHRVLLEVLGNIAGHGAAIMGLMISPLRGADGNVEFVVHAQAPDGSTRPIADGPTLIQLVTAVVDEVAGS